MLSLNVLIIINKNLTPANNDMIWNIKKKKKKTQKSIVTLILMFYSHRKSENLRGSKFCHLPICYLQQAKILRFHFFFFFNPAEIYNFTKKYKWLTQISSLKCFWPEFMLFKNNNMKKYPLYFILNSNQRIMWVWL